MILNTRVTCDWFWCTWGHWGWADLFSSQQIQGIMHFLYLIQSLYRYILHLVIPLLYDYNKEYHKCWIRCFALHSWWSINFHMYEFEHFILYFYISDTFNICSSWENVRLVLLDRGARWVFQVWELFSSLQMQKHAFLPTYCVQEFWISNLVLLRFI